MNKYVLPILVTCFVSLLLGCSAKQSAANLTSTSNSKAIQAYAQWIVATAKPTTGAGTAGSCVDCHTSTGAASSWPWADPNSQIAYNSGITNLGIVNVSDPSNSLLLQYLTNGHCVAAQCRVASGSAVYNTFVTAAENYAQATGAAASPSPSPSATPSASSTLVPVSGLVGVSASPVPLPSNPPLLGDSPLILNIPLSAVNAGVGKSSLQLSVAYTVAGTNSTGGVEYLYELSNPVLVNTTTTLSITVSGFYIALNGTADLGNNIFSNPNQYYSTVAPGKTGTLNPTATLDSISLLASPGEMLTLVIVKLSTGPP